MAYEYLTAGVTRQKNSTLEINKLLFFLMETWAKHLVSPKYYELPWV